MSTARLARERKQICSLYRSTKMINNLLLKHYKKANDAAAEGKPVAWAGIDFPAYLLWAMDIVPVFAQVHAAFQGQRKMVRKIMNELESKWEIPHNICGEVKGVIGAVLADHEVSFGLPKPDVLVTANSSCSSMTKGFKYLSEYLGAELLFADFPFAYDDINKEMLEFSCAQMKAVFNRLEEITGRHMDMEKLKIMDENMLLVLRLWEEICLLSTNIPAPVESLDLFLFSSSLVMLEADDQLIDLYLTLYNEIYEQAERNGKGEAKENFRLFWHYLPIYSQKNFFKSLFEEYGATVVTGTYFPLLENSTTGWDYKFKYPVTKTQIEEARRVLRESAPEKKQPDDYIREAVAASMQLDVNRNVQFKNEKIKELIALYKIDGVIMHCDRSCRPQSLPQYEIRRYLTEELRIPVLFFDADTMDERYFSSSQVTTRFEAFIEKMANRKNRL